MKKKTAIIIQARTGSSRLPNKLLMNFYKGKNILELILERLKSNLSYQIIIATTNNQKDNKIVEIATKYSVDFFRGSEENVLNRFISAAEYFDVYNIIRICADNPFLQVSFINQMVLKFLESGTFDYLSYQVENQTPVIKTHFGFFAEIVTIESLKKVEKLTNEKKYREHVTNYIYEHQNLFNVKFIDAPEDLFYRNDIRLTIDTYEDFQIIKEIYPKICVNDYTSIINYLDENIVIKNRMFKEINKNRK